MFLQCYQHQVLQPDGTLETNDESLRVLTLDEDNDDDEEGTGVYTQVDF